MELLRLGVTDIGRICDTYDGLGIRQNALSKRYCIFQVILFHYACDIFILVFYFLCPIYIVDSLEYDGGLIEKLVLILQHKIQCCIISGDDQVVAAYLWHLLLQDIFGLDFRSVIGDTFCIHEHVVDIYIIAEGIFDTINLARH